MYDIGGRYSVFIFSLAIILFTCCGKNPDYSGGTSKSLNSNGTMSDVSSAYSSASSKTSTASSASGSNSTTNKQTNEGVEANGIETDLTSQEFNKLLSQAQPFLNDMQKGKDPYQAMKNLAPILATLLTHAGEGREEILSTLKDIAKLAASATSANIKTIFAQIAGLVSRIFNLVSMAISNGSHGTINIGTIN